MTGRPDPAVIHGEINPLRWSELQQADWPVLWCRRCNGEMYADGPAHEDHRRVLWYEATCRTCHLAVAMPNGRLHGTDTRRPTAPKATPAEAPAYTPTGAL